MVKMSFGFHFEREMEETTEVQRVVISAQTKDWFGALTLYLQCCAHGT